MATKISVDAREILFVVNKQISESQIHSSYPNDQMPSANKTQAEKEISKSIIRFEKEFMGRGPLNARTYIIDDLVIVRLKNVLTPAELKLAKSDTKERGRNLIKTVRQELIEQGRPILDAAIKEILGIEVVSLHTDISAKTGERIIVFSLARLAEEEFI